MLISACWSLASKNPLPILSILSKIDVMDTKEHIRYWVNGSQEDLDAAGSLLEKGHLRHCMFFAHLTLEKAFKAHVPKQLNRFLREFIISYGLPKWLKYPSMTNKLIF